MPRSNHLFSLLQFAVGMDKTNSELVLVCSEEWSELGEELSAVNEVLVSLLDGGETIV
jgi:hypothetical protein